MDIRRILESHKEIDDRINLGLEEIAQLRALAENVSQRFTDESRTKGTHSDRVGNYAAKIADLEIKIDEQIDSLVDLKERIMAMAASLGSGAERMIIERRYILHEEMNVIADKLGYSPRHITRLHRKALERLEELYSDKVA